MKQKKKKPKEASFVRKDKYQIKEGVVDLHSLKLSELKERAKDLQVDIGNVDKRNSSEIRKTIWDQSNLLESDFGEKLVSVDDDEYGKKIRSEEHTSELQSRGHLVCRLLLEKKKRKKKRQN